MESNYYIPDIEDIRVGYECEICPNLGYFNTWKPTVGRCEEVPGNGVKHCNLDELTYDCLVDGHIGIRTPYLTKEQIEAEGWAEESNERMRDFYMKGDYFLSLKDFNTISICDSRRIDYSRSGHLNGTLYYGACPSINEFRTICKLLKIK